MPLLVGTARYWPPICMICILISKCQFITLSDCGQCGFQVTGPGFLLGVSLYSFFLKAYYKAEVMSKSTKEKLKHSIESKSRISVSSEEPPCSVSMVTK